MKLLAKIIIAVAIFIAGFYVGGQQALSPSNGGSVNTNQVAPQDQQIKVNLMLDFGNGQVKTYNQVALPKDSTVFDLLKKVTAENSFNLNSKDYGGELGVFIQGIGGVSNSRDKFWQYWINNEYSQVGASSYQLKNGDLVEWKYIKGQIQ